MEVINGVSYVVWSLFDDAQMSYYEVINDFFKNKLENYSIGINDKNKNNYHKIDLSIINFKLNEQLKMLPKPDIILASPPCESWSISDNQQRMVQYVGADCWLIRNALFYKNHNLYCPKNLRRDFFQKEQSRILGEATCSGLIKIIKDFKPKIWVIENPQSSKIWDYQEQHLDFNGFKNLAYYNNYDKDFSLKPTYFKSNIKMNLLHEKIKTKRMTHICGYEKRSAIPKNLIKNILEQILEVLNNDNQ